MWTRKQFICFPHLPTQQYYIRAPSDDSYPPDFNSYINGVRILILIGAEVPFTFSNKDVYKKFCLER